MAPAQKKSRKELLKEPDEFLTTTARALAWVSGHKRELRWTAAAVLGAALLVSGWFAWQNREETQAAALLSRTLERVDEAGKPAEALQTAAPDLERLIGSHGRTKNGRLARMLYANLLFEAGETRRAIALYEAALGDFAAEPPLRLQILKSLAYAHLALGEATRAIERFEQALALAQGSLREELLFHLGDLCLAQGQQEKGRSFFERLLREHPDSWYAGPVRARLAG
ncbi:MAG: tetratricopeptide repeat protein [Desulfobacterales bacterium]